MSHLAVHKIRQGLNVSPYKALLSLIMGINNEDLFSHDTLYFPPHAVHIP